jgi:hypothetical protein
MRKLRPSPVFTLACLTGLAAAVLSPVATRADSLSPAGFGDTGLLGFPALAAPAAPVPPAERDADPTFSLAVTPTADLPLPVGPETISRYIDTMGLADSGALALEPVPHGALSPAWAFSDRSTADLLADAIDIGNRTRAFGDAFAPQATLLPRVSLSFSDGAMSWALNSGSALVDADTARQSLSALVAYDLSGGHQLSLAAATTRDEALFSDLPNAGADTGWQVGAGANINLADVARVNAGVAYGEGPTADPMGSFGLSGQTLNGEAARQWGANAGLSFDLNATTSVDMGVLYQQSLGDTSNLVDPAESAITAQANVYWQPTTEMRLGWQVMWGEKTYDDSAGDRSPEELRTQFGAWFHF